MSPGRRLNTGVDLVNKLQRRVGVCEGGLGESCLPNHRRCVDWYVTGGHGRGRGGVGGTRYGPRLSFQCAEPIDEKGKKICIGGRL